ncbi:DegV family EDD domain-containing protein [Anaerocolumna sedimenticola]|uniref:DegV family EDD domain-containing protein n=1 Tax=Anaerocolumna sedimenticola TaxID=2696063 RepID=A0A6P1TM87_9FIRM|nr:DegV family protein [Anaerocolumna sedimenticola]QHQ61289.1 DegV family EDD domain-containing protein [Anaerocolumna sedimenticola]
MRDYHIFSDSSCDTPEELLSIHNITLVPFYVTFDQENYFKENTEITNQKFYDVLMNQKVFPKTSLPSVQDYINYFEPVILENKDILCLCLTQKFSGSYQSAVNAKLILNEKYPDAKISIIDSIQATAGQGIVLMQAVYMKEAGYTLEETENRINEIKPTARIMFTVDTLEYLAKGGRIGKVTSLAGTMLNLKPMIQLKDAELIPYSNVRGRKKAIQKILDMTEEYFTETGEKYEDYDFCLVNATTLEDTNFVQSQLEGLIGRKITYPVFQIGVTIGTYTGPGAVGVCFIRKYNAK